MKNWKFCFVVTTLLLFSGKQYLNASEMPKHIFSHPAMNDTLMNTASKFVEEKLKEGKKPNRLINEKSPYLLQHAFNPVDWYPWGEEAFQKARDEDKPVFLSVGYSTCYWCHVMEREVFENPEIAELMNKKLVCIKVDREERPDIDRVYMTAVQAIGGGGGWPMSVFMTPDRKPFFGATYIPPKQQYGRPGFPQVVQRIFELWRYDRTKVLESSEQITQYLLQHSQSANASDVNDSALHKGYQQFSLSFDKAYKGFGSGPKFPRPAGLNFLLRYYQWSGSDSALQMTLETLRAMANGGMYDHIGGGFHRYSVDGQWRVPHFEKMLYDQAQLAASYLEAYQITRDEFFGNVAREVLDYVLRNMTHPEGGFYSAEDAESALDPAHPEEKEEGSFYVWTKAEITNILGAQNAEIFSYHYGINDTGNALTDPMNVFTGKNVLYLAHTVDETAGKFFKIPDTIRTILHESRSKLYAEREKRPKSHLDDKVITAWNGLMISAFAKAYQILDEPRYLHAAQKSAKFIMSHLYKSDNGLLLRRFRDGDARFDGGLVDYSFMTMGLIDLYEASFDIKRLEQAITLTQKQNELFSDKSNGGFFDTPGNDPSILIRSKEDYDAAEPTGNSIAALNLLRLGHITDNKEWKSLAERTFRCFGSRVQQAPEVLPQMLVALLWDLSTPKEIIVAGNADSNDTKSILKEVHSHFIPNKILLLADNGPGQQKLQKFLTFMEGMKPFNGKATVYICENYACQLPASDISVIAKQLMKNNPEIKK